MNHEESNESRDESRESTPAAPGLRLGFPRFKNLSHQRGSLQAIHSRGAKASGRHGRLQGLFVVTFFYFGQIDPGALGEFGSFVQDRLKLLHLAETDLLISCKFAPDGFQDVPAHRRQSNFQVFKQELVRHFPQAAILHNLRNGRHKLGAQFLPLSPLCELLHTVLLQFGDWTARCEPRLHCPWCFHILQCFIHLTWVAHCCRRFLYCNFM